MALTFESFKKSLVYSHRGDAKELITDLNLMAESDAIAEKRLEVLNFCQVLTGLGVFIAFLAAIFAEAPFAIVMVFVLLGVLIVLFGLASVLGHLEVPNERYELPKKLIPKFLRDMKPNAPIQLNIDCRDRKHKQKKVGTVPDPRRSGWKIDRYADPWLQMQGQFLDQTHFQLDITEFTIEKYGWKRSRSGKSKFKRKTKPKGLELSLTLQFPRRKYGAITMLGNSLSEAISLPDYAQVKRLKVAHNRLLLTIKTPPLFQTPTSSFHEQELEKADQLITQMMLSLYHALNLAKKLSQPAS